MQGSTHFFAGTLIGVALSTNPFIILTSCFAALLPDIDERTSYLGRKVQLLGFLSRHRGWTHTLLFGAFGTLVFWLFGDSYALAFGLGFLSHLLLDGLTPQGVRLFPFIRLRGPFRTGGIVELFFRATFFLASFLVLFTQFM